MKSTSIDGLDVPYIRPWKLMTFFIRRKNNVSFSRYRKFCVFVKHRLQNL